MRTHRSEVVGFGQGVHFRFIHAIPGKHRLSSERVRDIKSLCHKPPFLALRGQQQMRQQRLFRSLVNGPLPRYCAVLPWLHGLRRVPFWWFGSVALGAEVRGRFLPDVIVRHGLFEAEVVAADLGEGLRRVVPRLGVKAEWIDEQGSEMEVEFVRVVIQVRY